MKDVANSEILIRNATDLDFVYYKKWLLSNPQILNGFPMTTTQEVDDALKIWKSYLPIGSALTVCVNQLPVGGGNLYLSKEQKFAHHALFVMIIDPLWHRKGIGTALLSKLLDLAKNAFALSLLHLEVYEKNPAIHLYEKLGFKQYGYHPKFLKQEDGTYLGKILMGKEL